MNVLVACEESQAVCKAFRAKGHKAFSCDLQECSGGHPEWHIKGDVLSLIEKKYHHFSTQDGTEHCLMSWDLIIAHPPCTFLTSAGACRLFDSNHKIKDHVRYEEGVRAAEFFYKIMAAPIEKIAIENPTPIKIFHLPQYSQIIQPYMFGDPWTKRTCLWLKNLPCLQADNLVKPEGYWVNGSSRNPKGYRNKGCSTSKMRSKTFPGIARAMAEQWG